jgi:peptidoglycan/LPS O-acetylase OafA/YrhL
VVLGAVHATQIRAGALTRMGHASYSLYLAQVFTIPAAYRLVSGAWSTAALAVALSALAALLLHRYVERLPQRLLEHRRLQQRSFSLTPADKAR